MNPGAVLGINERNLKMIYPNNPRHLFPLADDKAKTKEILTSHGIPCPETYSVIQGMGELEQKLSAINQYKKLVIKPACGSGGGGILLLQKDEDGNWLAGGKQMEYEQIKIHVANTLLGVYSLGSQDKAIIEYCLEPHRFFSEIYAKGVPDFRVIVYKQVPVMAMVRIPTDESGGKANLHQGAIAVGVDLVSGIMKKAFYKDQYFTSHPDTKKEITGKLVPQWEDVIEISKKTAQAFPLNYLGVDIVFDDQLGPLVMEINVRPGLAIQLANQQGLKELIKKVDLSYA